LQIFVCSFFGQECGMSDPALEYIRAVMKAKNWTAADLARAAHLSHSTINRPLTTPDWPNAISRKTIEQIEKASGISAADFIAVAPVSTFYGGDNGNLVPVYAVQASAGPGALVTSEDIVDRLAFPPDYLRHITKANPKHLAIIGCKGDSMTPTLKDDDLVMIDTSKTELSFEGMFVVKIDGGTALLVKRIGRASQKGHIKLISDNPAYPAVEISVADVVAVGKVIWAGVKM